eukprot:SM000043S15777  [mRNA]  locus=s43:4235:5199:+ [translate_table: standard]
MEVVSAAATASESQDPARISLGYPMAWRKLRKAEADTDRFGVRLLAAPQPALPNQRLRTLAGRWVVAASSWKGHHGGGNRRRRSPEKRVELHSGSGGQRAYGRPLGRRELAAQQAEELSRTHVAVDVARGNGGDVRAHEAGCLGGQHDEGPVVRDVVVECRCACRRRLLQRPPGA